MAAIIAAAQADREKAEQARQKAEEKEDRERAKGKVRENALAVQDADGTHSDEEVAKPHHHRTNTQERIVNESYDDEEKEKRKKSLQKQNTLKKLDKLVPEPKLPGQKLILEIYHGPVVQIGVAVLIVMNFAISSIAAQIGPANCAKPSDCWLAFHIFEWFFNILFGIELLINIYAHWFCPFWKSGWNIFDFVIVLISWVTFFVENNSIAVLRLFRAFRAFRLFKRIEEVRIIIVGVVRSLPGVSNAFVLLIIVMGIWAIMGVSFFRHEFPDFFGTFFAAMLTLFQVMTFDSWVSQITRPICLYYNSWGAPLYFISYALIAGIIMTNVVVAILLDKFMRASTELQEAKLRGDDELDDEKEVPDAPVAKVEPDESDKQAERKDKSEIFWGKLEEHFYRRVQALDTICRGPMPQTLIDQEKRKEEQAAKDEEDKKARRAADVLPGQSWLKELYDSQPPQLLVAGAIVSNFFISATQAEAYPAHSTAEDDPAMAVFGAFEWFFNLLFGIELVVNMYSNGRSFWKDNWNIFDFFIVLISWASMLNLLSGGISVLRLFRAFRVFRLFKRVKALRQIIAGIMKSLPGVSNAFVILFLVMGIWSIMGCNFFGATVEPDSECKFQDEFGNFSKAMLSMFQVMSYDSWSSGITRPVVTSCGNNPVHVIFFLTFVFISSILMMNVVLAILLDKFLAAAKEFNKGEEDCASNVFEATIENVKYDDLVKVKRNFREVFAKSAGVDAQDVSLTITEGQVIDGIQAEHSLSVKIYARDADDAMAISKLLDPKNLQHQIEKVANSLLDEAKAVTTVLTQVQTDTGPRWKPWTSAEQSETTVKQESSTPIPEILEQDFDECMWPIKQGGLDCDQEIETEMVIAFKDKVLKKLETLDALVTGELKDLIESQKSQTVGFEVKRNTSGMSWLSGKKSSRVAPA